MRATTVLNRVLGLEGVRVLGVQVDDAGIGRWLSMWCCGRGSG